MNKTITNNLILLLTAMIWGGGFVAQRTGMDYLGPLAYGAIRFALAALVLLPVIFFLDKKAGIKPFHLENKKNYLTAGLCCGIVIFTASTMQQYGLVVTSAGKTAFLTAIYIVIVPFIGLFFHQRPPVNCWLAVGIAACGIYLLCVTESFALTWGDSILLISAVFWALHLLIIDKFLDHVNAVKLAFLQFAFCAVFSFIAFLIVELDTTSWQAIVDCAIPLIYAGALSGGVGFTLQIVGQQHTPPVIASLILSMESVFGAIGGYFLLNEALTQKEIWGCALMFAAIIISQIPDPKRLGKPWRKLK